MIFIVEGNKEEEVRGSRISRSCSQEYFLASAHIYISLSWCCCRPCFCPTGRKGSGSVKKKGKQAFIIIVIIHQPPLPSSRTLHRPNIGTHTPPSFFHPPPPLVQYIHFPPPFIYQQHPWCKVGLPNVIPHTARCLSLTHVFSALSPRLSICLPYIHSLYILTRSVYYIQPPPHFNNSNLHSLSFVTTRISIVF